MKWVWDHHVPKGVVTELSAISLPTL